MMNMIGAMARFGQGGSCEDQGRRWTSGCKMVTDNADGKNQIVWILLGREVRLRHEHGMRAMESRVVQANEMTGFRQGKWVTGVGCT